MKFKKTVSYGNTSIVRNEAIEGETIETKIERIVNNGEPITDGAPIVYTERKDGVRAETNIRTDRFEIAVEAMDKVSKSHTASRSEAYEKRQKAVKELSEKTKKDGGTEPI